MKKRVFWKQIRVFPYSQKNRFFKLFQRTNISSEGRKFLGKTAFVVVHLLGFFRTL